MVIDLGGLFLNKPTESGRIAADANPETRTKMTGSQWREPPGLRFARTPRAGRLTPPNPEKWWLSSGTLCESAVANAVIRPRDIFCTSSRCRRDRDRCDQSCRRLLQAAFGRMLRRRRIGAGRARVPFSAGYY